MQARRRRADVRAIEVGAVGQHHQNRRPLPDIVLQEAAGSLVQVLAEAARRDDTEGAVGGPSVGAICGCSRSRVPKGEDRPRLRAGK